jgi:hypothetical protein
MGTVVITYDFELAWGATATDRWRQRERDGVYDRMRQVLPGLLAQLRNLEIPTSWGVVGAMLEPPGRQELDHLPEKKRREILRAVRDGRESSFYGHDLVTQVVSLGGLARLCSHTYSHTRVDLYGSDAFGFETDLRTFERAVDDLDVERKLIYPENREGFADVLAALGYTKVRGADPSPSRLLRALDAAVRPPPLSRVSLAAEGVARETSSLFFNAAGRSRARRRLLMLQLHRGLRAVKRTDGVLHVYSHPFNLAESDWLHDAYIDFLKRVARLRDQGYVDVRLF